MYLNLWDSILKVESAAESIKQRLIRRPNFSIQWAFSVLDANKDGYISAADVSYYYFIYALDYQTFAKTQSQQSIARGRLASNEQIRQIS